MLDSPSKIVTGMAAETPLVVGTQRAMGGELAHELGEAIACVPVIGHGLVSSFTATAVSRVFLNCLKPAWINRFLASLR